MTERNDPNGPDRGFASIRVQRRIEWWDTDASGYYHNTAVARLLETAETLLLSRLGFLHEVYGRLPRAHLEMDFLRPLAFHDVVDVDLAVTAVGRTSATYEMTVRRGGEACVTARAVVVLLDRAAGRPVPWEEAHRLLLTASGPLAGEALT
ncbi:MAG TPA: hotdog domain-containing protein [Actinomycetota bacterium]|nr:hotdog domain-containing protein [Actinomycetota bacterium]